MDEQQNINFTQTEVEALLEMIAFCKERDFKDFEDYVKIENESIEDKLNSFDFEEE